VVDLDHFKTFTNQFFSEDLKRLFREQGGFSEQTIEKELNNFTEQSLYGYQTIAPFLPDPQEGKRLLEVGAGSLILSAYLKELGFNVVALEPIGIGFEFLRLFSQEVMRRYPQVSLLNKGAEALEESDGLFDLIFSINVIEHLPDPLGSLEQMWKRLAPGGRMLHGCPNYLIPFDPHFSIPLIPGQNHLVGRIFRGRIAENPGLWDSINHITSLAIKRRFDTHFFPGQMTEAFDRLQQDQAYAARHPFLKSVQRILSASGLLGLLRKFPGEYLTPMFFEIRKP